jgi:hypothetical protein
MGLLKILFLSGDLLTLNTIIRAFSKCANGIGFEVMALVCARGYKVVSSGRGRTYQELVYISISITDVKKGIDNCSSSECLSVLVKKTVMSWSLSIYKSI